MSGLNATHDPARRSWLESANDPSTDFPIQNLPFGIYEDADGVARGGVAIGDQILDLTRARAAHLFAGAAARAADAAQGPTLNPLLALGNRPAARLRAALIPLLDEEQRDSNVRLTVGACLVPMRLVKMRLPLEIGTFTAFAASEHHLRRMRNALPRAFKYQPLAYTGRATSIVVSGTAVQRPQGHVANGESVAWMPEPALDFGLALGAFLGGSSAPGTPIAIDDAEDHLFGLCLLDDWSARGIALFEGAPLAPFLGSGFATSISPWIVTTEALRPFRVALAPRAPNDPEPPHLTSPWNDAFGAFDVELQAFIQTSKMRASGRAPERLSSSAFRMMSWTFAQMLAHQTSNGTSTRAGDLLGSGAASDEGDAGRACLAELTARGIAPVRLANGEDRAWLQDGDEVILRGRTRAGTHARIGFGECRARITPATLAARER